MGVLMCMFSLSASFASFLPYPTFLLVLSSLKGFTLSTIPNAHMEANKYYLFVPSQESFNVKVTWQIFPISNVKTTMDFLRILFSKTPWNRVGRPRKREGCCHSIPLKAHREWYAHSPHSNTWNPRMGHLRAQRHHRCQTTTCPLPVRWVALHTIGSFLRHRKSPDVHTSLKRNN